MQMQNKNVLLKLYTNTNFLEDEDIMLCPHYKKAVDKCKSLVGTAYINPLVTGETTVMAIT